MNSNANEILIRKVELSDLDRISEVNQSAFGNYSYPFSLRQNFDLFGNTYLVACIESRLVGFCLGAVKPFTDEAWILDMGVIREKQGFGIGRKLLEESKKELQSLGVNNLFLTVDPTKKEVVRFYQNHDFIPERDEKSYYGSGRDRIVMKAIL